VHTLEDINHRLYSEIGSDLREKAFKIDKAQDYLANEGRKNNYRVLPRQVVIFGI